MRKLKFVLVLALGAVIPGIAALSGDASGQQPKPGVPPELKAAVKVLVHRLATKRDGLRLGMPAARAVRSMAAGTHVVGSHTISLSASEYAPGPGLEGVIDVYISDDDEVLDQIRILLLVGEYDREEMAKFLIRTATAAGFADFTPDDETSHLYWGDVPGSETGDPGRGPVPKRDLWVSLGKGVIAFESGL